MKMEIKATKMSNCKLVLSPNTEERKISRKHMTTFICNHQKPNRS